MTKVHLPIFDHDDAFFWQGAAEGKLLIQRCTNCRALRHPPAPMCARCASFDWDTIESFGRGVIRSWIVSQHPTEPATEPRIVILVELDEGTRLVSNLHGSPADNVANGLRVEAVFVDFGDIVLPQFRLATDGVER
jgi:uncharacterized OB-fold protein